MIFSPSIKTVSDCLFGGARITLLIADIAVNIESVPVTMNCAMCISCFSMFSLVGIIGRTSSDSSAKLRDQFPVADSASYYLADIDNF